MTDLAFWMRESIIIKIVTNVVPKRLIEGRSRTNNKHNTRPRSYKAPRFVVHQPINRSVRYRSYRLTVSQSFARQLQAQIDSLDRVSDLQEENRELQLQLQREQERHRYAAAETRRVTQQLATAKSKIEQLRAKNAYDSIGQQRGATVDTTN